MAEKIKKILTLLLSIALAQSAGLIGAVATRDNIETWYRTIEKPGFTPPDWVFPIVWPLLYLLMGVAAWLIYNFNDTPSQTRGQGAIYSDGKKLFTRPSKVTALSVYGIHLVLNALWSFLFFKWHLIGLAFFEIFLLLLFILATTRLFYQIKPLAGYLMAPYILWVAYAFLLNGAIWWLNT